MIQDPINAGVQVGNLTPEQAVAMMLRRAGLGGDSQDTQVGAYSDAGTTGYGAPPAMDPVDLGDPNMAGARAPFGVRPQNEPYTGIDTGPRDHARQVLLDLIKNQPKPGAPIQVTNPKYGLSDAIKMILGGAIANAAAGTKGLSALIRGYTDSKQRDVDMKTQIAQTMLNRLDMNERSEYAAKLNAAQAELGFANQDIALESQARAARAGDAAKSRKDTMVLAQKYHDNALDEKADPEYRLLDARQAITLLRQIDDPTAEQMAANLEAKLPMLEKESSSNKSTRLKNERTSKVLENLDQDLRDKHENIASQISQRRAMLAIAINSGDVNWFKTYTGLFDTAIKDVDEQLKRWQQQSQKTPMTQEEFDAKVQPLIDYRNRLNTEKSSIPMPGKPSSQVDIGQGGISLPPGTPIGVGDGKGGTLPLPSGSFGSAPVTTTAGAASVAQTKAKEKQDADAEKQWAKARDKIVDLRAKVAGAEETYERPKVQRELDMWVQRAEKLRPGSILGKGQSKGAQPKAEPKSSGNWLRDMASNQLETLKKNYVQAKEALDAGVDKEMVKNYFKGKTGKDYDEVHRRING